MKTGSVQVRLILWVAVAWAFRGASAAPASFAGFAETDITPPVGIALGGRGCKEAIADGVLDPLRAAVTVLRDARNTTLVIASLDLAGLPRWLSDRIRSDIAGRLRIPPDHVILNCSHTHSGPMMYREIMAGCGQARENEKAYMGRLADKVVDMTSGAAARLRPVIVHFHQGTSDLGINRRGKLPSGQTSMIPNPGGAYEPAVWIMRLASPEGKTLAVLFSYACHPVIVYGYALNKVSAEYPGVARREIRAALAQDVHAQFIQGPAGDVRPRCLADLSNDRFRNSRPQDLQDAGKDLASAVLRGLECEGKEATLDLATTAERVYLKRGAPPARSFYENIVNTAKDYTVDAARYWLDQYDKGGPFEQGDRLPVGVVRLTRDQWALYMAGEPVAEWAKHARTWFGDRHVVVWGYSQQVGSYIPVDEILKDGGYEVVDSARFRAGNPASFAPGLNDAIRASVLQQISRIESAAR